MEENVRKLFCILNHMESAYCAGIVVINFEGHFGKLDDDDYSKIKRLLNDMRDKAGDDYAGPFIRDARKFPMPKLISENAFTFSRGFQDAYEKVSK